MHYLRVLVPSLITAIIGLVLVAAIFIPAEPFATLDREFSNFFDIVAVFAFILGGGNLLRTHLDKVQRLGGSQRFFSLVTITGFAFTLIVGTFKMRIDFVPDPTGNYIGEGTWFKFVFDSMYTPLSAAMFSLLAFFVASASFRAFRARTKEATLLLIAAFVILLGRTPLGHIVTGWFPDVIAWLRVENFSNWILSVPNLAGQRAILIGIALGIISTSLKLILGLERSHLSGEG
jgi:hypothetical protein